MKKDVIIIGAGAAGLICAIEAGRRGRTVLVIDHAGRAGNKIRVSGGGRCNFTNLNVSSDHYLSDNPRFCRSALARFTPGHFMTLLKRHGISFHEKEAGQLFCNASSSAIVGMLRTECDEAGVEFLMNCTVESISKSGDFTAATDKGTYETGSLVIATGGLSWPKLGASGFGIEVARQFNLHIIPPRPGLVPFTLSRNDLAIFRDLSGVSVNAEVSCRKISFRGNILFTHRGLSGPAMLQISSHWNKGDMLSIDLLPDMDAYDLLQEHRGSRKEIRSLLSRFMPERFARVWCGHYLQTRPVCQLTEKELKEAAEKIRAWKVIPSGTEGYEKAEVTVGGIDTKEVSSKTMESNKVPGLYFIGEVLDVTGHVGG
jgi:predicted Rossmann fold flavoprotein